MTRQSAIVVFLAILAFLVTGCQREKGFVEHTLDTAEILMQERPDSALSVLGSLNMDNLTDQKTQARYSLLKSMALDKNYIDLTTFTELQPALNYYLKKGTPDERLKTYYYQGRIYQNSGEQDKAMESFMRGREYLPHATDTMTIANLLVAQGALFYITYKIEDFIENNLKASQLYQKAHRPDYEISCLVNALDGSIIRNNKSLADSIIDQTYKLIDNHNEFAVILTPYILTYVTKFGTPEEIRELLRQYCEVDTLDDTACLDMAAAYCHIGDAVNAKRYFDKIDTVSTVGNSVKYLATRPYILELNGDYAEALSAQRSYSAHIDSIHHSIFTHDLLFASERHAMEIANLMSIQKKNIIISLSSGIAFMLLIIAGVTYYRYRQENYSLALERKNTELERERHSLVIENMKLKIEQLESESSRLKELLNERKDLAAPVEEAIKVRIEMLNSLLATQITENDAYARPYSEWRDKLIQDRHAFMNTTRLAFKASHPKFIDYLEQHGLTEAEINYICLYAIGLRGKEAGEYMQLRRHYHISSDIRKKLGIDEHQTNIGIYIRKLMKQL